MRPRAELGIPLNIKAGAMTKWLIIDGYNLIHRTGDYLSGVPMFRAGGVPRDLAGKRRRLIQLLEKTVGILAERITVVF